MRIGVVIIAILVTWLLLAVLRGRLHPVGGLGVALGVTVLLFPVVQPWYLLWAVIPLAAWATRPAFRGTTIVVTLVVGIFGPTANGDRFTLFQIVLAPWPAPSSSRCSSRSPAPAAVAADPRPRTGDRHDTDVRRLSASRTATAAAAGEARRIR